MLSKKVDYALFEGRFQPFHIGHLKAVRYILNREEKLLIGLVNPNPFEKNIQKSTFLDISELKEVNRHFEIANNPFSFWERLLMIYLSLIEDGIDPSLFYIVPLPLKYFEDYDWNISQNFLPQKRHWYIFIKSWEQWRIDKLEERGEKVVKVAIKGNKDLELMNSSDIRDLIRNNDKSWKKMVTSPVVDIIENSDLYKALVDKKTFRNR